jgi:DNA (cytosine-5)-methyltransferase 1|tara:strand:- start:338 stop:952 length:615 start_codon:yes stop_codon:yes gene_type:complete
MKILNLYAGIGGNRKLWGDEHEVTAVEINEDIAGEYKNNFPNDKVIVGDAHEYLLRHYKKFDFIWSSPPCPTHSVLNYSMPVKRYPSMQLYQEIIFLQNWFKGKWVIENVKPYYEPLVKPSVELGRHIFWSNFNIVNKKFDNVDVARSTSEELAKDLNLPIPMCQKARLLLRNCVKPEMALHIFDCAFKEKQKTLNFVNCGKED